jgi:adenosylhomocysteine nucleosidase
MKVLVTYAVEAEFAPWRSLRKMEKVILGGLPAHRAQLGRATVDFVATGVGTANAKRVTQAVISNEYSFCIVTGFAGALRASVKLGDVVMADKVQQQNHTEAIFCARNLVTRAAQNGAKSIQLLLSADHVVDTAAEKERLSPLAEAVDMESFAVLDVARAKNLPAAAIRVISDSFDRDLPAELDTMVNGGGNVKAVGVARYLAKHPLSAPALMRLGRDSKSAAEALAHFLDTYIEKSASETQGLPPSELREVAAS